MQNIERHETVMTHLKDRVQQLENNEIVRVEDDHVVFANAIMKLIDNACSERINWMTAEICKAVTETIEEVLNFRYS